MVLRSVGAMLLVPASFFESRRPETLQWHALGAILFSGLVSVVGIQLLDIYVLGPEPGFSGLFWAGFAIRAVLGLVVSLLVWVVLAGVVHLLVHDQAPSATFVGTFAILGIAALLDVPATVVTLADPYVQLNAMESIRDLGFGVRAGPVNWLAWAIVTLWKGYVWRQGFGGAYDVDGRRATLAACVAVGVHLLWLVFP